MLLSHLCMFDGCRDVQPFVFLCFGVSTRLAMLQGAADYICLTRVSTSSGTQTCT